MLLSLQHLVSAGHFVYMSIEGKHWYRFNYLKSDEWKDQRNTVLAETSAKCYCCEKEDLGNDIHHIWYGPPNSGLRQLIVLCRECHSLIHKHINPPRCITKEEKKMAIRAFNRAVNVIRTQTLQMEARANFSVKTNKQNKICKFCCSFDNDVFWVKMPHLIKSEPLPDSILKDHWRMCKRCFDGSCELVLPYPAVQKETQLWAFFKEAYKLYHSGLDFVAMKPAYLEWREGRIKKLLTQSLNRSNGEMLGRVEASS